MERYTPEFKAKIVLEALKSSEMDSSIAQAYDVHPVTLSRWKTHFLRNAHAAFESEKGGDQSELLAANDKIEELTEALSLLKEMVEDEVSIDAKIRAVDAIREVYGLNRACDLFGLPKSTYYYRAGG